MLKNQLDDLQSLLGPSYAHVGVGRDDGKAKGEFSPIFYDSDKFEQVDWDTIWLSPTPGRVASKGWDAVGPVFLLPVPFHSCLPPLMFAEGAVADHRGSTSRV